MASRYTWTSFHTRRAHAFNSGGNVMLDVIELNSSEILVISDEIVCRYSSIGEFYNDYGDHDYDKHCIDLVREDPHPEIRETCYFCKSKWGGCECKINVKPFMWNGMEITNPLVDSSGRFFVNPYEFYGDAFY